MLCMTCVHPVKELCTLAVYDLCVPNHGFVYDQHAVYDLCVPSQGVCTHAV